MMPEKWWSTSTFGFHLHETTTTYISQFLFLDLDLIQIYNLISPPIFFPNQTRVCFLPLLPFKTRQSTSNIKNQKKRKSHSILINFYNEKKWRFDSTSIRVFSESSKTKFSSKILRWQGLWFVFHGFIEQRSVIWFLYWETNKWTCWVVKLLLS